MGTTTTPNYSLIKPDSSEPATNFPAQTEFNMDLIDTELAKDYELLDSKTIAVADGTILVNNINQDFAHLRVILAGNHTGASAFDSALIRFNGDTAFSYAWGYQYIVTDGTATVNGDNSDTSIVAPIVGSSHASLIIDIQNYSSTSFMKGVSFSGSGRIGSAATSMRFIKGGGLWTPSTAISEVRAFISGNDWAIGTTLKVYGLR